MNFYPLDRLCLQVIGASDPLDPLIAAVHRGATTPLTPHSYRYEILIYTFIRYCRVLFFVNLPKKAPGGTQDRLLKLKSTVVICRMFSKAA